VRTEDRFPIPDSRFPVGKGEQRGLHPIGHRPSAIGHPRAFTLVEILVVVALMSVIVLGLLAMFDQTQRAFHLGMNQTDVLESGRIATDILVRDLEQVTPTGRTNAVNFYAAVIDSYGPPPYAQPYPYVPTLQLLPSQTGNSVWRTNVLEDLFFVTRENQTWSGIGYYVRTNGAYLTGWGPVGALYRFETNNTARQFEQNPAMLWSAYYYSTNYPPGTNVSKILDGVVDFQVRAYDLNGNWINTFNTNVSFNVRSYSYPYSFAPDHYDYFFYSNTVPAYVEVEVGVLEQQTWERYQSIPDYNAQTNYLSLHAGNVHLFRERVPIRNVDPSAYQ